MSRRETWVEAAMVRVRAAEPTGKVVDGRTWNRVREAAADFNIELEPPPRWPSPADEGDAAAVTRRRLRDRWDDEAGLFGEPSAEALEAQLTNLIEGDTAEFRERAKEHHRSVARARKRATRLLELLAALVVLLASGCIHIEEHAPDVNLTFHGCHGGGDDEPEADAGPPRNVDWCRDGGGIDDAPCPPRPDAGAP